MEVMYDRSVQYAPDWASRKQILTEAGTVDPSRAATGRKMRVVPAAVVCCAALIALAGCGSSDGAAAPGYGSEGPATPEELEACFASQEGDVKLTRSTENGIIYARGFDAKYASGVVITGLIEDGKLDGTTPAKAIKERTSTYGDAATFEPYRSGTFVVYSNVRPYVIDPADLPELKPALDACLPVSDTAL